MPHTGVEIRHREICRVRVRAVIVGDEAVGKTTFLRTSVEPQAAKGSRAYLMTTKPEVATKLVTVRREEAREILEVEFIVVDLPGAAIFHQREDHEPQVRR